MRKIIACIALALAGLAGSVTPILPAKPASATSQFPKYWSTSCGYRIVSWYEDGYTYDGYTSTTTSQIVQSQLPGSASTSAGWKYGTVPNSLGTPQLKWWRNNYAAGRLYAPYSYAGTSAC